jgi:hypothetical protein
MDVSEQLTSRILIGCRCARFDIAYWKSIEEKAIPLGEKVRQTINKLVKKTA